VKAEVEYTALVSAEVDLETGEVVSVGIGAARGDDETPSEVSVSLEGKTDAPNDVFDRAQQLVESAAPFELQGWWAPAPGQRWGSATEDSTEVDHDGEDRQLRLHRPPAKAAGEPPAAGEGGR
jgi:hypothetical protein